jgi:hypothetical protein
MAAYHVFIEGAVDGSASGIEQLAAAIAARYGLPVAEVKKRLASGRFRVKGNCDRPTADTYVRDLTELGARCSIDEATPQNRANTPLPFPAQPSSPRPSGPMQSGLSAAFSGDMPAANLGALADGGMMKLSSVDGVDDRVAPSAAAFAPPGGSPPAQAAAAKPSAEPVDMFAPPDAADEAAFKVELAPDEAIRAAKKRASVPPVEAPIAETPAAPVARISRPSIQPPTAALAGRGLADPKTRLAVGVVVAIVLGFVPAHMIASAREHSAYGEIDAKVAKQQAEADTPDTYDVLDGFRDGQLARKYDERRNIAILALLIWGVVGGGVAYVWFRRVPWDKLAS